MVGLFFFVGLLGGRGGGKGGGGVRGEKKIASKMCCMINVWLCKGEKVKSTGVVWTGGGEERVKKGLK